MGVSVLDKEMAPQKVPIGTFYRDSDEWPYAQNWSISIAVQEVQLWTNTRQNHRQRSHHTLKVSIHNVSQTPTKEERVSHKGRHSQGATPL